MHTAILQRLNTELMNDGIRTKYPAAAFATITYDGIPLIYAENGAAGHPPEGAAKAGKLPAGYRVVGTISDTRVSPPGEPRIDAMLHIDDDTISKKAVNGALSISTAFSARTVNNADGSRTITGGVVPDHVLIFEHSEVASPNDGGAYILNMRTEMPKIYAKNENVDEMLDELVGDTAPIESTEGKEQDPNDQRTFDEVMAENAAMKARIAELEAELARYKSLDQTSNDQAVLTNARVQNRIDKLTTVCANLNAKVDVLTRIVAGRGNGGDIGNGTRISMRNTATAPHITPAEAAGYKIAATQNTSVRQPMIRN